MAMRPFPGVALYRIDHEEAHGFQNTAQTDTNNAGVFPRTRRGEIGYHHLVAGSYLLRLAQGAAWREDHKRDLNRSKVNHIVALAMGSKPNINFSGYWHDWLMIFSSK
jgi:hypothetical protein